LNCAVIYAYFLSMANKIRLTLEFDQKAHEHIERVRERTMLSSKTAVIQSALALFDLATEHVSKGGEILFKGKDGKSEKVNILS